VKADDRKVASAFAPCLLELIGPRFVCVFDAGGRVEVLDREKLTPAPAPVRWRVKYRRRWRYTDAQTWFAARDALATALGESPFALDPHRAPS
jgi:hypothetical protein